MTSPLLIRCPYIPTSYSSTLSLLFLAPLSSAWHLLLLHSFTLSLYSMTKLKEYEYELQYYPNDRLITEEISHRRFIASYITSLTLTCSSTAASAGTLLPLTVPICAFKAHKIQTHRKQLKMVRRELQRRALSPMEKRKRDVFIPVAAAFTIYAVTFGIADAVDLVPEGVQEALHAQIEGFFGVEDGSGGLDKVGNTYEAFILAEAATPLTNALVQHGYRPGCPPPLPPRPSQKIKDQ